MEIAGKKAIVFGGTSGVGLATAIQLEEHGANVVAISRDPSKAKELKPRMELEKCDARNEESVGALLEKLAPFEILVSAATGGVRATGPFLEMDMNGYRNSFDKLWGYANVVRHGTQYLPEDGVIILVSGTPARRTKPGMVAIGSVGGAVEAFARGVAREIAPRRINVVSPGLIDTPMWPGEGTTRQEMLSKMTETNLIPRIGKPDEVAHAIVFAIENDYLTGTTIDVDGGLMLT